MSQLSKNVYMMGSTTKPFGLMLGQSHGPAAIIRLAGWFNKNGERLGFGDLNSENFAAIANGLQPGEFFVVLESYNADIAQYNKKHGTQLSNDAPGIEHIMQHAVYVVGSNQCYYVNDSVDSGVSINQRGTVFQTITKADVQQLLIASVATADH